MNCTAKNSATFSFSVAGEIFRRAVAGREASVCRPAANFPINILRGGLMLAGVGLLHGRSMFKPRRCGSVPFYTRSAANLSENRAFVGSTERAPRGTRRATQVARRGFFSGLIRIAGSYLFGAAVGGMKRRAASATGGWGVCSSSPPF